MTEDFVSKNWMKHFLSSTKKVSETENCFMGNSEKTWYLHKAAVK
jgi:hypothetical protein